MHHSTVKTHVDFELEKHSASILFLIIKAIFLTYFHCFVSHLVRPPCYQTLVRPSLTIGADHRSNRSLLAERSFCRKSSMNMFTIPTTFRNAHALCYTPEALLTQSATQVGSLLLDSSMLWQFREAITSPIIVFTSSTPCFGIGHQRQSAISSCCDLVILWLCNDWSMPRAPEKKHIAWKYSLQFISTFGRNISLSLQWLRPVAVFQ